MNSSKVGRTNIASDVARKTTKSATARVSYRRKKDAVFTQKKREWANKNAARYGSTAVAAKPVQNHLSTDEKVAVKVVNIPVVDTGTTPYSVAASIPSFQQFLDYQQYCEETDFGFLNVRVEVECVKVGLNPLGPA